MFHLLIADDDITILEGLSKFINLSFPETFQIHLAENGIQALDVLKQNSVHICLSDIKMPMLDGIKLSSLLSKTNYGCKLLILSGYDDYPFIRSALKSGACDYLLKPVNFSLLFDAINEIISNPLFPPEIRPENLRSNSVGQYLSGAAENQPEFYDIPLVSNPFINRSILQEHLEQCGNYIINLETDKVTAALNQFFRRLHPSVITRDEVRDLLSQFIYNLMHKNSGMIKIISTYKLTDLDILSCIKNMPTLSQLQKRFVQIILIYMEKLEENISQHDTALVKKAVNYIENNYACQMMLEDIAAQFHLHPNYFSRLFKQQTGITFRDYLRNLRIRQAKLLLADPSQKISCIAEAVGYKDTAHFIRAFKDITGTTPSVYRKTLLSG